MAKNKKRILKTQMIAISIKLKEKLNNLGKKGDTYEDILWRLIKK